MPFRLTLMAVLMTIILLPSNAWADIPNNKPDKFSPDTWEAYSIDLMVKLFPEFEFNLRTLKPILITQSPRINADTKGRIIVINYGLIALIETEDEYAAILAHEYGHILLAHESTTLFRDMFIPTGDDLELLEKQEIQADRYSLDILRRGNIDPCVASRILTRVTSVLGIDHASNNRYDQMNMKRVKILSEKCSLLSLPDRAQDNFSPEIWRIYTQNLLRDVSFAGNLKIEKFSILISSDKDLLAQPDSKTKSLHIGYGLINLVDNESEYVFVLAHEACHIENGHKIRSIKIADEWIPDFIEMERVELEADMCAFQFIVGNHYDLCAPFNLTKRLADNFGVQDDPNDPYNKISFKRVEQLRRLCPKNN